MDRAYLWYLVDDWNVKMSRTMRVAYTAIAIASQGVFCWCLKHPPDPTWDAWPAYLGFLVLGVFVPVVALGLAVRG